MDRIVASRRGGAAARAPRTGLVSVCVCLCYASITEARVGGEVGPPPGETHTLVNAVPGPCGAQMGPDPGSARGRVSPDPGASTPGTSTRGQRAVVALSPYAQAL